MKTLLRLLSVISLVLLLSSGCWAAVHSFQGYYGDFLPAGESGLFEMEIGLLSPGSRLFTVTDQDQQLVVGGLVGFNGPNLTLLHTEYYLSDFVFGDFNYQGGGPGGLYNLRGGYLWEDLGLFAGLDFLAIGGTSGFILAGGYRFDLGDGNYAALSANYYGGEYDGFFEFEAHAKYRTDAMKVTGQMSVDQDGDVLFHVKANIAASDELVWGGGLNWYIGGGGLVFAGLTWERDSILLDGLASLDEDGDLQYNLSGLYDVSDSLALGVAYSGSTGASGLITFKGEYLMDAGTLTFSYLTSLPGIDSGVIGLGYKMEL